MSVAPAQSPATRGKGAGRGRPEPKRDSEKSDADEPPPPQVMNCPIPLCGGWCAPTENPEEGCWRHFSNENTVPAQACFFACLPCIETNKFCQIVGHFAFQVGTGVRKCIFSLALVFTLAVLVMFIIPVFGVISSEGAIRTFHWYKGTTKIHPTGGGAAFQISTYIAAFGTVVDFDGTSRAQRRAIKAAFDDAGTTSYVIGENNLRENAFDPKYVDQNLDANNAKVTFVYYSSDFCATGDFDGNHSCNQKEKVEDNITIVCLLVLAFLAQFTAAMANCQRFTEFGDVNCQKFWGFLSAILVCLSAFSIYTIAQNTLDHLPTDTLHPLGHQAYAEANPVTDAPKWEISWPIYLIFVAGFIKLIDIIIHCLIATPPGRHYKPDENNPYIDLPDYMLKFQNPNHAAIPYSATH